MRRTALLVACASLAGCAAHRGSTASATPGAPVEARPSASLSSRSFDRRPQVVVLEREGDPAGAVAVAVALPDLITSTALLAILEVRLSKAGLTGVDGRADRVGLRVRAITDGPDAAARATLEVLRALAAPIGAEPDALRLASARVAALSTQPADDPALLPLLRCTGQGLLAGEAPTAPAAEALEAARARVVGWSTVTVGFVGPSTMAARVADAVGAMAPWDRAGQRDALELAPASFGYIEPTRPRGTTRVVVARASSDPHEALLRAEPDRVSAVSAHLARVGAPRLARVQATAHERGSCVALEVEFEGDDRAAAAIARVLRDELSRPAAPDPSIAARAVARLDDPRDAAAAAALFGSTPPAPLPRTAIVAALGVAPPRQKTPELDVVRRDAAAALSKELARTEVASSGLEVRVAVEPGRHEAWVALGSTCPASDPDADDGLTAAIVTALASRELDGVALEPWVSATGAGLVAHAPPRDGEGPAAHTRRVARAAATALLSGPPRLDAVERARRSLLTRLDEPAERARELPVAAMARGRIAHFLPWGTTSGLARIEPSSPSSTWASLASGPLRVVIISPSTQEHAVRAAEELERLTWGTEPRRCQAVGAWDRPAAATRAVQPPAGLGPRAYVVAPVDARRRELATAVMEWARDPEAASTSAVRARGVSLSGYLLGDGDATMLVLELAGPAGALEATATELSAALRSAARAPADGRAERARAAAASEDWRARASPRQRALELFRGPTRTPAVSAPEIVELAKQVFAEGATSVIIAASKAP